MEIAILVQKAFVAGTKPPVDQRASIGLWIVFISAKHAGTLDGDLPALLVRKVIAVLVHHADANASAHADRPGLAMPGRKRIRGHLMRRFRHSVGFHERHTEEALNFVNEFR